MTKEEIDSVMEKHGGPITSEISAEHRDEVYRKYQENQRQKE